MYKKIIAPFVYGIFLIVTFFIYLVVIGFLETNFGLDSTADSYIFVAGLLFLFIGGICLYGGNVFSFRSEDIKTISFTAHFRQSAVCYVFLALEVAGLIIQWYQKRLGLDHTLLTGLVYLTIFAIVANGLYLALRKNFSGKVK